MDVRGYGPIVLPAGVTPKSKHGPRKGVTARYRPSTVQRDSQGLGAHFQSDADSRRENARIERLGRMVREGKLSYTDALARLRA